MAKRKLYVKKVEIPIFNVTLWILIGEHAELAAERNKMTNIFDGRYDNDDWYALACNHKWNFGLFFPWGSDLDTKTHEAFHVTHRILEYTNCNFDETHHEQGALLCGHINKEIEKAFKDARSISRRPASRKRRHRS